MRHLTALALAAALLVPAAAAAAPPRHPANPPKPVATPPPPAAEEADKPVSTKVEDLAKLLDEAKIEYTREGGHLRITF
ncbi:MAG TPA: hypothetical protein VGV61_01940, partial [Thermoanaerobaculia bacterium]|nr:hypothetical protein [Thermoanaerobaculia bacterium]